MPHRLISKILCSKILLFLGQISYSLYLWQQIFIVPFGDVKLLSYLQSAPFNLLFLLLVSYLSYKFIEAPFIVKGRILSKRLTAENKIEDAASIGTLQN